MKKRLLIATLILFVLILCIFWGITQKKAKNSSTKSASPGSKKLVINWLIPEGLHHASEDYLNKILSQKGYDFDVHYIVKDKNNYQLEVAKSKSSGEAIDIITADFPTVGDYWNPYFDLAKSGYYLPLEPYLKTDSGKKLYDAYDQKVWKALDIGGSYYAVTDNFIIPWQHVIIYNKKIADKYNIDASKLSPNIWDWEGMLAKIANGEKSNKNFKAILYIDYNFLPELLPGYSQLSDLTGTNIGINENGTTLKAVNIFTTDYGKKLWKTLQNYEQKGYMQTREQAISQTSINEGDFFIQYRDINSDAYFEENKQYFPGCSYVKIGEDYVTSNLSSGCNGIASWSKHPDEAFELLSAIMTDPDLSNAFIWGQKGVDYDLVNGHTVAHGTQDGYAQGNILFGNNFIAYPSISEPVSKARDFKAAVTAAKESKLIGFNFDGKSLKKEIDSMTAAYREFFEDSQKDPYNKNIDELNAKLDAAGMQKVLDEINLQLKNWKR